MKFLTKFYKFREEFILPSFFVAIHVVTLHLVVVLLYESSMYQTQHLQATQEWRWPKLAGEFHGSGCTLASAIAGRLAMGDSLPRALDKAQRYTQASLAHAYAIAPGQLIPQRERRNDQYD